MIECQYEKVKPFVKKLLIAYTIGFYIPYVYACYLINYKDLNDEKDPNWKRSPFELKIIYFMYALAFIT
jgi:hypothetical protein